MWKKTMCATVLATMFGVSAFGFTITGGHIEKENGHIDLKYPLVYLANEPTDPQLRINENIASLVYSTENKYYEMDADYEGMYEINVTLDYEVPFKDDHYVSIVMHPYYSVSGGHASTLSYGRVYDLQSGARMYLRDFIPSWGEKYFKKGVQSGQITPINESGNKATPYEQYKFKDETNETFYIHDENTLVAVFQPYEIGPGAEGTIKAFIPFDLKSYEAGLASDNTSASSEEIAYPGDVSYETYFKLYATREYPNEDISEVAIQAIQEITHESREEAIQEIMAMNQKGYVFLGNCEEDRFHTWSGRLRLLGFKVGHEEAKVELIYILRADRPKLRRDQFVQLVHNELNMLIERANELYDSAQSPKGAILFMSTNEQEVKRVQQVLAQKGLDTNIDFFHDEVVLDRQMR